VAPRTGRLRRPPRLRCRHPEAGAAPTAFLFHVKHDWCLTPVSVVTVYGNSAYLPLAHSRIVGREQYCRHFGSSAGSAIRPRSYLSVSPGNRGSEGTFKRRSSSTRKSSALQFLVPTRTDEGAQYPS